MATRELKDANQKATETDYGVVKLAADGDTTAGEVVQGDDARLTAGADLATHIADTSAAHAASAIAFTPNGTIAATTVQAAIQEVRDEATTGGYAPGGTDVAVADGGTGASSASAARTNLGLAIGTDVQAYDADLAAFAAKTAPSGAVVGTTDTQTLTNKTLTADQHDGYSDYAEIAAPSTPASGKVRLYAKSDGLLYSKDDAGTETAVSGGGGGGGASDAVDVTYDPTASGLAATDVQAALDEIAAGGGGGGGGTDLLAIAIAPGDMFVAVGTLGDDLLIGGTATDTAHSGSDTAAHLIDNDTSDYWSTVSAGSPPWTAKVDTGSEDEAASFAIMQYDASSYQATEIKVQGSHDGSTWTDIDGTHLFPASGHAELQVFQFDNHETYRHWALVVLAGVAGTGLRKFAVYSPATLAIERVPPPISAGQVLTATTVGSDLLPRWA